MAQVTADDLKRLLVENCVLKVNLDEISEDTPLFGPNSVGLDSLDALQICLAVKDHWDVRIEGGPEARIALASVTSLAQTIIDAKAVVA